MTLNRIAHSLRQARIIGDQNRLRRLIMLGLREKISRNPIRLSRFIGQDENF